PSDVQPMLLRVLETGEFLPVGGVRPRPVDVRVVAATDARLGAAITAGQFRAPLLHRLAGYEIQLPPLAARREDLGLLLRHFLDDATSSLDASPLDAEGSSWPPASVVARLARHDWPGNVRELRNVAHWLAITGRGCRAHELAARLDERLASVSTDEEPVSTSPIERPSIERPSIERTSPPKRRRLRKPEEIDLDELRQALVDHRYEIRATARALGVSRANLYRLIDSQPSIRKAAALDREEIDDALARHADDLGRAAMDLGVSLRGLKLRLTTLAASEREDA
ncbi:MAG: sigma 54-interacting transcriptional regulator, partial [Acidobacteriota bacterium]